MKLRRSFLAAVALLALLIAACGSTPGATTPSGTLGPVYGIPKDFNTLGLVYNKDLFKAAGIAEPTNDWSWTDLSAAAKKLTTGGVVGLSLPADAARFMPFLWQAGGDLANINNAAGVAATDFYTGFEAKDGVSKLTSELGICWPGEAFEKGKAAMVFEGG